MSTSELKLAITGPFTDINFGDYAMVVNNIYDLDIKNLLLFSYDSRFLDTLNNDYFKGFNIEVAETVLKDSLKINFLNQKRLVPFELLKHVKNLNEIEDKIEKIDILLVNGGGYFNGLWSLPHRIERLVQIIIPILVANRLGKKVVFSGNGFGPFDTDSEFFSNLFGSLKNITFNCRDNLYSPVWLRQLGISDRNINIVPDDLLIINEKLKKMPTAFSSQSKDYIVLETYLPLDYLQDNIQAFKSFSETLYQEYNLNIVFLPFHLANGGMDQGKLLANHLDNFELIDISKKGYLPIQDAISIIQNAKLVLSNRYHAVVLALSTSTPTFSVLKDVLEDKRYYYNKNRGVVEQVLEGVCIDEEKFFSLDYLQSLEYVQHNFNKITSYQNKMFDLVHTENIRSLSEVRKNLISSIL